MEPTLKNQALRLNAAVLIQQSGGSDERRHLAIVYMDDDSGDRYSVIHLASHNLLKNEPFRSEQWMLMAPRVHNARLLLVAAMCRAVWKSNGKDVPYAFSSPSGGISAETGKIILGPTTVGFTCASFVLAVFEASKLPLAKLLTWPLNRQEDIAAQEFLVGALRDYAPTVHIEALKREVGLVRYRPEEVAAASEHPRPPVDFVEIKERSLEIVSVLNGKPSGEVESPKRSELIAPSPTA